MLRGGCGKGAEIVIPPPPVPRPRARGGSREALLHPGHWYPGLVQRSRHIQGQVLRAGCWRSQGIVETGTPPPAPQGLRARPAPGFPRWLRRPPASRSPTQPRSPRSRARAPAPHCRRGRARAVSVVPGGSRRPRGGRLAGELAPGAPGARPIQAGARAGRGGAGSGGGALAASGVAAATPSRRARTRREGRAPGAGGHGWEPEAAAGATEPAGWEGFGPRPLTAPSGLARPRAFAGGGGSQATPGAPAHPPLPFFFFPGGVRGSMPAPGRGQLRVNRRGVELPPPQGRAPLPR